MAVDDAVARVDGSQLADGDVLGLRLGDLQLGLQLLGLNYPGQEGARAHALANVHGDLLQHAGHTRFDAHSFNLALLQLPHRAKLLHGRLLHGQLRLYGIEADLQPLLLDLVPVLQVLGRGGGLLGLDVGGQSEAAQLGIAVRLEPGGMRIGFHRGRGCLLCQAVALQLHLQVVQLGLGGLHFPFGIDGGLLELGVAQNQQHGTGRHDGAGKRQPLLDTAVGFGRNHQASVDRHQGAKTADLAQHRPALDAIHPDLGPLDARSGGLQPAQYFRRHADRGQNHYSNYDLPDPLVPRRRFPWDVHMLAGFSYARPIPTAAFMKTQDLGHLVGRGPLPGVRFWDDPVRNRRRDAAPC